MKTILAGAPLYLTSNCVQFTLILIASIPPVAVWIVMRRSNRPRVYHVIQASLLYFAFAIALIPQLSGYASIPGVPALWMKYALSILVTSGLSTILVSRRIVASRRKKNKASRKKART